MKPTSFLLLALIPSLVAQETPYDVYPEAKPPYYRVRYDAGSEPGALQFAANYTIWIPPDVETLRGVIVHQHGCGEGSCKSGLTAAFDLHWQALAKAHDCALLGPSYEQPQSAECQLWCDPRNGSGESFQKALNDLGTLSSHPELATIPWALWGHSGGGHWVGGMTLMYPHRVAATWMRSGVPLLEANPERSSINTHDLPDAALEVPMMCNPGTKEGVTLKTGRFAKVWPANETFIHTLRAKGALLGLAVDPLSAHECGNQRYLAIPWLDACLAARLPKAGEQDLLPMPVKDAWLAPILGSNAVPAAAFSGDRSKAIWLPNQAISKMWQAYVATTEVSDSSPPPAPTNLQRTGNLLSWDAEADVESGIRHFIIERNGAAIATVPEKAQNRFGRPLFQGLQYSDTPIQPLAKMHYVDASAPKDTPSVYRVISVNTAGLKSIPSAKK